MQGSTCSDLRSIAAKNRGRYLEGAQRAGAGINLMLPVRTTFPYNAVPDVSAAALRAEASRIRKLVNTTTAAIIEIGCALISVKQSRTI